MCSYTNPVLWNRRFGRGVTTDSYNLFSLQKFHFLIFSWEKNQGRTYFLLFESPVKTVNIGREEKLWNFFPKCFHLYSCYNSLLTISKITQDKYCLTVLLGYNLHTINSFILSVRHNECLWVCTKFTVITKVPFRTFPSPHRSSLCPFAVNLCPHSSPMDLISLP